MATPIPNTQRAAVEKDYNEAEDLITVNGIDSTKCANEDVTFEDKGEVKWTGLESDAYGMLKSLNKEIPPVENESITRCNSGSETSTSSTPPSQGRYLYLPKQRSVVPSFPSPGPLLGNTPLVDSYPNSHQRKKDIEVVFEDYEEHNRRRGSNTKKRRLDSDISSRGTSSTTSSPDTRPLSTTPILGTINTSTGTLRSLEELSMCPMRPNSLQMFGGEVQILDGAGETKTMRIEPSSRGNKTSTPSGTTTGIDTMPTLKETPEKEKVAKKVPKLSVDTTNESSTEKKNQEDGTVITKFRRPTSLPLKPGTFVPKKTNSNGLMSMGMVLSLVSPETPRPKKSYGQLYLNGHAYTYLGLKCSTRAFYCTLNRPQPMYVLQSPEHATLSMYSNWKTCLEADPNPFGLEPGHAMCLYDSRHRPAQYSVAKPHEKQPMILTHSSYWLDKHKLHRNREAEKDFAEVHGGVADQGTKTNGQEWGLPISLSPSCTAQPTVHGLITPDASGCVACPFILVSESRPCASAVLEPLALGSGLFESESGSLRCYHAREHRLGFIYVQLCNRINQGGRIRVLNKDLCDNILSDFFLQPLHNDLTYRAAPQVWCVNPYYRHQHPVKTGADTLSPTALKGSTRGVGR
uniref:(California timema) hypothetical protein n=1 Tax=Timema californicum TaxID=61474 RepID=A0A7R9P6B3_TIMCA|nr:unnamed protein product [Timema californicum]